MPLYAVSPIQNAASLEFRESLRINVRMPDGGWVAPPARTGGRVLDALERFGLPLRRPSGAIWISARWCRRVAELADANSSAGARLMDPRRLLPPSLLMTPDLDGLEIELDWDALELQTYWIAG